MPVDGCVQAFNSSLEVANFPLKERSRETLSRLEVVTARRKVEIREMEVSDSPWPEWIWVMFWAVLVFLFAHLTDLNVYVCPPPCFRRRRAVCFHYIDHLNVYIVVEVVCLLAVVYNSRSKKLKLSLVSILGIYGYNMFCLVCVCDISCNIWNDITMIIFVTYHATYGMTLQWLFSCLWKGPE